MPKTSWICTVCGYVYVGEEIPAYCPVCGADKSLFEPKKEGVDALEPDAANSWSCLACSYLHQGDAPPESCPVCGSMADHFEPIVLDQPEKKDRHCTDTIVIVGAGISGISAAEAARKAVSDARIIVVSREKELPYYRLNLTRYLAGELAEGQLQMHPAAWYEEQRIELVLDSDVKSIDVADKSLEIAGREKLSYDKLILSMGAHSFIPPIEGSNLDHVQGLRTRQDASKIIEMAQPKSSCVVIGGGVLGLEAAAALAQRGTEVTIIEGFDWLLPRQLNRSAGELLAGHVEKLGVRLICGGQVSRLEGGSRVEKVILESGEELAADLVIFAAGVRCNSALARQAQLEVNNGILVDNSLRTSDPNIFAVGDVAEHQGMIYGTWMPAQAQGAIAGLNATGGDGRFLGIPRSNNLKVLDVDLFSIGKIAAEDGSYQLYEINDDENYYLFVFRNGHLVGAILLGDTQLSARVKEIIENQSSCSEVLAATEDGGDLRQLLNKEF